MATFQDLSIFLTIPLFLQQFYPLTFRKIIFGFIDHLQVDFLLTSRAIAPKFTVNLQPFQFCQPLLLYCDQSYISIVLFVVYFQEDLLCVLLTPSEIYPISVPSLVIYSSIHSSHVFYLFILSLVLSFSIHHIKLII